MTAPQASSSRKWVPCSFSADPSASEACKGGVPGRSRSGAPSLGNLRGGSMAKQSASSAFFSSVANFVDDPLPRSVNGLRLRSMGIGGGVLLRCCSRIAHSRPALRPPPYLDLVAPVTAPVHFLLPFTVGDGTVLPFLGGDAGRRAVEIAGLKTKMAPSSSNSNGNSASNNINDSDVSDNLRLVALVSGSAQAADNPQPRHRCLRSDQSCPTFVVWGSCPRARPALIASYIPDLPLQSSTRLYTQRL